MLKHGKYRGKYDSRRPSKNDNIFLREPTESNQGRNALEDRAHRLAVTSKAWSDEKRKPVKLYLNRVARARNCQFRTIANMAKRILLDRINDQLFAPIDPIEEDTHAYYQ